jgi:hypothetical protein
MCSSIHHPAGTAKMGRDDSSVVDSRLRVYGVNHMRVADASIMPQITTGNTRRPALSSVTVGGILTGMNDPLAAAGAATIALALNLASVAAATNGDPPRDGSIRPRA